MIIDEQVTHSSLVFISQILELNITIVYLLPHLTHFLQPLDVSIFCLLKAQYEDLMTQNFKWALQNTNKSQFVEFYEKARQEALNTNLIIHVGKKVNLFLFDPMLVLTKLDRTLLSVSSFQ